MRDQGLTGRSVEERFAPSPASVSSSRRFLDRTLRAWECDDLSWTASLLLSELATNAVLHAGGDGFRVGLQLLADGSLRLEISDSSVRPPRHRDYGTSATTGRGVALVDQLSRDWGVQQRPGGKTVWCELVPEQPAPRGLPLTDEQDGDVPLDLDAFLSSEDADATVHDPGLQAAA